MKMTLKELLELGIITDNVRICYLENELHCKWAVDVLNFTRNTGLVTIDKLLKAGLDEKYLSHKVIHIFGDKYKFKMGIHIEK
jgi:hypothetical protein